MTPLNSVEHNKLFYKVAVVVREPQLAASQALTMLTINAFG
jgi:hypothetical protein